MGGRARIKEKGIAVWMTTAARQLIGPDNVPEFVKLLTELLEKLDNRYAYVRKKGVAVNIQFVWRGGKSARAIEP